MFPKFDFKDVFLAKLFYTLSSFTFLYYENFQWIECWGLFPIVMLGIKRIGEGKSSLLYVVSYSILLLISYYIAWLTVLATLFASMLYFWFFVKKENRLRYGARMIVAIILSVSPMMVPAVSAEPLSASRFSTLSGLNVQISCAFKLMAAKTAAALSKIFFII